uniref:Calcineurin-like phosphoesterase n=1 Tax=viral metagenome TaxID=1070528 RepID=A0A6H1ZWB3_9ZZZZ
MPEFQIMPKKTWVFSDPHFDHTNIIEYTGRPFKDKDEMNQVILNNWCSRVQEDHIVLFLGDMAFGKDSREPKWWASQLPGRIIYLEGSHDHGVRPTTQMPSNILVVADRAWLDTSYETILLIHDTSKYHCPKASWVFHGHSHNKQLFLNRARKEMNFSAEVVNYTPVNLEQAFAVAGIQYVEDNCWVQPIWDGK